MERLHACNSQINLYTDCQDVGDIELIKKASVRNKMILDRQLLAHPHQSYSLTFNAHSNQSNWNMPVLKSSVKKFDFRISNIKDSSKGTIPILGTFCPHFESSNIEDS